MRRKARRAGEIGGDREGAGLGLAVGAEGGFRHIAADDRIADQMHAGPQRRFEGDRIDRAPARRIGKPGVLRQNGRPFAPG